MKTYGICNQIIIIHNFLSTYGLKERPGLEGKNKKEVINSKSIIRNLSFLKKYICLRFCVSSWFR